ncbi:MAG: hypothetical protein RMK57_15685 [Bryobacterales bacterium]|nr:hypothetical protein [Bryobacteraceae bacterium]MDW8355963.1 hypothetical protein [Bryobacterales bacterium]
MSRVLENPVVYVTVSVLFALAVLSTLVFGGSLPAFSPTILPAAYAVEKAIIQPAGTPLPPPDPDGHLLYAGTPLPPPDPDGRLLYVGTPLPPPDPDGRLLYRGTPLPPPDPDYTRA